MAFLHSWDLTSIEAINLQKDLAEKIINLGKPEKIDLIAGIDLSYDKESNTGFCSCVLLKYPDMEVIKIINHSGIVSFPYIPGLLSFREGPLITELFSILFEAKASTTSCS